MLKRLLLGSLLITGVVVALPSEARAQKVCAEREAIVARLKSELGEVRVDGAAAGPAAFYEFYASRSTRTWTILLSRVNGVSCVVAVGQDWQRPIETTANAGDGWPRPGALLVK
jgi:hypothetical protein